MKKLMGVAGVLIVALLGLTVTAPASAAPMTASETTVSVEAGDTTAPVAPSDAALQAEVVAAGTGDYEWVCVGIDGNSWSMANGQSTTDCHGSYLQKYLDGRQLGVYALAYGGGAANAGATGCILAVLGTVLLLMSPANTAVWYTSAAVAAAGIYTSCKA